MLHKIFCAVVIVSLVNPLQVFSAELLAPPSSESVSIGTKIILEALAHASPLIREDAIMALSHVEFDINNRKIVNILLKILKSERNSDMQIAVALLLGKAKKTVAIIYKLIEVIRDASNQTVLRVAAINSLCRTVITSPIVIQALIDILKTESLTEVKEAAEEGLYMADITKPKIKKIMFETLRNADRENACGSSTKFWQGCYN